MAEETSRLVNDFFKSITPDYAFGEQCSPDAPDYSLEQNWAAQYVKSNAIIFCKDNMTLGVGAGQMSRVDSTRIAAIKAENANLDLSNSVVASDAFFPFRDGIDVLAKFGAKCVIQPGGSVRDDEVIEAANELGLVMLFTKVRHFKH